MDNKVLKLQQILFIDGLPETEWLVCEQRDGALVLRSVYNANRVREYADWSSYSVLVGAINVAAYCCFTPAFLRASESIWTGLHEFEGFC